jgi:predicted metal-dependent hydrolase
MQKIFEHPRFGDIVISRSRAARRISLSVRPPAKVRLSLPVACSWKEGLNFLAEKEQWIAETLAKVALKNPVLVIEPPYATTRRTLVLKPSDTDKVSARVTSDAISVTYPRTMSHTDADVQAVVRKAITHAFKLEAMQVLPAMVDDLARRHGFRYGKVGVRATTSRWGSCSSAGDISLCVFLMRMPDHLKEFIILHELCHTRHRDHSPRFHQLLDSLLGGREKELAQEMKKYRTDVI